MNWKDVTSFSQSDTDRTPRTWETRAGGVRIIVHRHRDFSPDVWLLSAAPFFDLRTLKSVHVDEAKAEATALILAKARAILSDLGD